MPGILYRDRAEAMPAGLICEHFPEKSRVFGSTENIPPIFLKMPVMDCIFSKLIWEVMFSPLLVVPAFNAVLGKMPMAGASELGVGA